MKTEAAIDRDDRELTEAVLRSGDEEAFRQLYRRHTPRLLGFVHRLLGGTAAEAEDIVQETWIRACEGLGRFQWNSLFSTWLLGIGLNAVGDHQRRASRSRPWRSEAASEMEKPPKSLDDRIDLDRSIALLPDGYRTVFVLHDVEGWKHEEIARRLGISAGTSKSQLSHGRKVLRGMLCESRESGNARRRSEPI